jgi:hypothetical protein
MSCKRCAAQFSKDFSTMRGKVSDVNLLEILDRVMDNGIVVAPSALLHLMGVELAPGRMVIESITMYA